MNEWFKARSVWGGAFEALSDAEAGRLVKALWKFATTGEIVDLSGAEKGCYAMFILTLQQDVIRNEDISAKRSLAGQASAEARKEQKSTNSTNVDNKNKNQNKNKEDIKESTLKSTKEKRDRFSPPTVEEVEAYCKERGNKVIAQNFMDFYTSKGWRIGNNPMRDWRACVRTWEQRDEQRTTQKPKLLRAQDYEQREYKEAEMQNILGVRDLFKEEAG